jgi:hypothetical protein
MACAYSSSIPKIRGEIGELAGDGAAEGVRAGDLGFQQGRPLPQRADRPVAAEGVDEHERRGEGRVVGGRLAGQLLQPDQQLIPARLGDRVHGSLGSAALPVHLHRLE